MVAPLIVGAARVVGGKRLARGMKVGLERPELVRRIRARERRKTREENPLTSEQKKIQGEQSKQHQKKLARFKKILGVNKGDVTGIKKIQALAAGSFAFWTAIWFWPIQFFFWLLSIIGLGGESVPVIGYFFPGVTLFWMGWFLASCIGILMMLYVATVFITRGVKCASKYKGVAGSVCFALHVAPLAQFFPWFVLWIAVVILDQSED